MELMVEIKQKDTGATLFRSERESLRGSDLRGAWLCVADLSHADLHGARLNGTCLRTADLRYADLTGADLHGEPPGWETTPAYYALMLVIGSMYLIEEIHKKELIGVGVWALFLIALTTRIWSPKAVNLVDADLRDTCLIGADLRGARIDGANFQGAVYDATTKWPARFNVRTHGAVLKSSE